MVERPDILATLRRFDEENDRIGPPLRPSPDLQVDARRNSGLPRTGLLFSSAVALLLAGVVIGRWWSQEREVPGSMASPESASVAPNIEHDPIESEAPVAAQARRLRCPIVGIGEPVDWQAGCRGALPGRPVVLVARSDVSIQAFDDVIRLSSGDVTVQVTSAVQPVEFEIAESRFSVRNGLFDVAEMDGTIHLEVIAGRVVLHDADEGRDVELTEGSVITQPAGSGEAQQAPARRRPRAPHAPSEANANDVVRSDGTEVDAVDVDAAIESVAKLREQGRAVDAADVLRSVLASTLPDRTAEVLSFELGDILTRSLDDVSSACEHWRQHLSRFPAGRYDGEVRKLLDYLDCRADGLP